MYKLYRVDIEKSQEIFRRIKEFSKKLKKELPVKEVYLYGSFAEGNFHQGSDIDLIVIGDFKERFFERIGKILELTDLPVEPLAYTQAEFDEFIRSNNPFIINVMKKAIRVE